MNLRELFEAGALATLAGPAINRAARRVASKEIEKDAGTVAVPRVNAKAVAQAQEKEENPKVGAAFCFGRFNPAHQGHAGVWDEVAGAGHKWYIGTNPTTIGPNDPLPFNIKTAWMEAIDPKIKGHVVGETSVVTLASKIYADVGEGHYVSYVTDQKDWEWSGKLLKQYNGVKGPHGYYNFKDILHVASPRVTSATDLRNAARAGNEKLFYKLSGTDPSLTVGGKRYFETVAEACGQHPEKVKKSKSVKETNQQIRQRKKELVEAQHLSKVEQEAGVFAKRYDTLDTYYDMYRLGVTIAGGDAHPVTGHGPNSDSPSVWMYTPEEAEKIAKAEKRQGIKGTTIIGKGQSSELESTNKKSTTAARKPNKYGV
jgi:hypothetical protein